MEQEPSSSPELRSLKELKQLLTLSYLQCSHRGLLHSASWAAELANSLDVPLDSIPTLTHSSLFLAEFAQYNYGKSLYDLREFRRASYALRDCQSEEGVFLKLYCLYLAGEKVKADEEVEALTETTVSVNPFLQQIKSELAERDDQKLLDGFGYYLYGVIEKELGMISEAKDHLIKGCHANPLIWCAWEELYKLCDTRDMLILLTVPDHWMKDFFLAAGSLEIMQSNDALIYYTHLSKIGFGRSRYIVNQLGFVNYQLKDFCQSKNLFKAVRELDPYILTCADIYSHVLFVMEMLPELYQLAMDVDGIDKYRSESCSVLANFYSLYGDHEKACSYFRRAVRLDKTNHTSWILLGHEYLELKNHTMAIDAYTRALETNKLDFRSYYGLGHTYELLKMPYFALSYYKMAHSLQPSDNRVLYALGFCYDELDQVDVASKCYSRAVALHDSEGSAITKLAKLHVRLGEAEEAAKVFSKFLAQIETGKIVTPLPEEEGGAHLYLARYHLKQGHYSEAEAHAHKATEFLALREEGKSLLQEVYKHREPTQGAGVLELDIDGSNISPIQ